VRRRWHFEYICVDINVCRVMLDGVHSTISQSFIYYLANTAQPSFSD